MHLNFFSKYFPVPRFLNPSHIGVSFSDKNIKIISFDNRFKKPVIKSKIIPLKSGTITDGKIVDSGELKSQLVALKNEFDSSLVLFAVPDEITYLFETVVPVNQGVSAYESVAFTIEENAPILLSDAVFDFKPTKVNKTDSGYESEIVVAACVKKEVEKFIQVINESGFETVGCVHESQAISNALIPKNDRRMFSVVHIRSDRIGIYFVKDNLVYFSTLRTINNETEAGSYEDQFLDEYKKFLEYSERYKVNNEFIVTTFVCGEFDSAKKIVELIDAESGLLKNMKLANVWENLFNIEEVLPNINYEDSLNLAGPVGSVLSPII